MPEPSPRGAPSRQELADNLGEGSNPSKYPWNFAYEALVLAVREEASALRVLVRDSDTSCPARLSRQNRLAGLEWVLSVADELERWEW